MCRFAGALLLASALLLSAARPAASQDKREWSRRLTEANHALMYGRAAEAERGYRESLRLAEQFGQDDWRLTVSLRNLGLVLLGVGEWRKDGGRLDEAERIFLRLLAAAEKSFDPEQTRIDDNTRELLIALNSLARIREARGRFAEAEGYYRRAVDIQRDRYRRRRSGENARAYGASVSVLAKFYCARGMYAEAKAIDKKIVPECVLDAEERKEQK